MIHGGEAGSPEARPAAGYDPFSPAFQADPYPFLRRLRAEDPVHFSTVAPELAAMMQLPRGGIWVLTRHADVAGVLRDPRFSARKPMLGLIPPTSAIAPLGRTMLLLDPPDHTRLRGLVVKAFTPRVVAGLRPRIEALVQAQLGPGRRRGRLDLIAELAAPLPILVIAELLGIPRDDWGRFRRWSGDLVTLLDATLLIQNFAAAEQSAAELTEYLDRIFDARRVAPRDDLVSALVGVRDGGRGLSDDELRATCMLLLIAGHETTTNLIGNGALALLVHPRELARLRAQPALVEFAVEEALRWDPPVQLTSRVATADVEIEGRTIRAGEEVDVSIAAANRDPAVFERPDAFDVGRTTNPHVAFGFGPHFCLGASLARLEAAVALRALATQLPDARLDDAPRRRPGFVLRGVTTLPIACTPCA